MVTDAGLTVVQPPDASGRAEIVVRQLVTVESGDSGRHESNPGHVSTLDNRLERKDSYHRPCKADVERFEATAGFALPLHQRNALPH